MRTGLAAAAAITLLACSDPAPPSPAPEAPRPATATDQSANDTRATDPPATVPPATVPLTTDPPTTDPTAPPTGVDATEARAASLALAIDPLPDAVTVVASVARGRRQFVLYTIDHAAVARAALEAQPDGAARLEAIDEALRECDDVDDFGRFECAMAATPEPVIGARELCEAHGWGVAVIEDRAGTIVRSARRSLFAVSCDRGEALGELPTLRVRDFDGDGREELQVRFPVELARDDGGMGGSTVGVIAYLLDERLRTQFRVTSHFESMDRDVAGTLTSCRAGWVLSDLDADGHADVRIRARCTDTYENEETDDARTTRRDADASCRYDLARDAWGCDVEAGTWLFDASAAGLVGEQPEDLRAILRVRPAPPAPVEAEDEDDDDGEDE